VIHAYWDTLETVGHIVTRAVARAELSPPADPRRVIEFAAAPVYFTAFVWRERITDAYLNEIGDFIVAGCNAIQLRGPRQKGCR